MSAREKDKRPKKRAQEARLAEADAESTAVMADVSEDEAEPGEGIVGGISEASETPTPAEEVSAATYDVYLEETAEGVTLALILDLPGCYASGASRQEALEHLQKATVEYHAWLRCHDEYTPDVHSPFVFNVKEVFQIASEGDYEIHSFFAPDAEPASEEDIEWALTLLGWQREDLLDRVGALADEKLDWKPTNTPDSQSIREMLDHIAQAEVWYMGRLDETPPRIRVSALAGPTIDRLQRVRQAAILRVKSYPKELRGRVFTHRGEQWTLRKALRRAVWHERDHLNQIDEWVAAYPRSSGGG
ncbi:MAG TPA: type II toxin-antitoxin system HicB family antitoxin [Ktedonobacterales bacterium]